MNDTMYHRGPDDSGAKIYEGILGYNIGFAQRRLSILDLSALGHQPMESFDGKVSVVFNGEIYNYKELKSELTDYAFKSNCDTEVIIAAYLKWGLDCVSHFNGMFAIALFDKDKNEVFLIRDRIGKKPLFYELSEENGGVGLYFASELKPIINRPGFKGKIRTEILSRFLFQQYINAPDTVFENVYKLSPGSILRFALDPLKGSNTKYRQIQLISYWDIKTIYHKMRENPVTDYAAAKDELKELLNRAVKLRLISDVPLGAFLSGGYDSSLMTAIACEHSKEKLKTFSIGFNEEGYNEAIYAKKVAEYLGTEHTEMYISEEDMFKLVESIPEYYDEPFADSSQIATMLVSELARQDVTVALSGDGGDEFFCGYNIYDNVKQAQSLDIAGALVYGITNAPLMEKANLLKKLPFRVQVVAENRQKETKTQFGASSYIEAAHKMISGDTLPCKYEIESGYKVKDWQIRRMLLDMDTYLPGDILCKVDRASMKYSLEARCPILDKDVMEYSFRLNHEFKYSGGIKKRILKDIAYDYIPKELLDRPKVGFGVPIDKWLRGVLKDKLLSYADKSYLERQGIFNAEYTSRFINDFVKNGDGGPATGANFSKLAWSFFVFEQWYEYYFK